MYISAASSSSVVNMKIYNTMVRNFGFMKCTRLVELVGLHLLKELTGAVLRQPGKRVFEVDAEVLQKSVEVCATFADHLLATVAVH